MRLTPAEYLVQLPDHVSDETAAAAMLKDVTACYLIEDHAKVRRGPKVLVHAAAGGMGSIFVPWLAHLDATVIAHAGTEQKADLARAAGASHTLSCAMDELALQVRELTGEDGAEIGVDGVDGVGAVSWDASLASLGRMGRMVSYGQRKRSDSPVQRARPHERGLGFRYPADACPLRSHRRAAPPLSWKGTRLDRRGY